MASITEKSSLNVWLAPMDDQPLDFPREMLGALSTRVAVLSSSVPHKVSRLVSSQSLYTHYSPKSLQINVQMADQTVHINNMITGYICKLYHVVLAGLLTIP